MWVIRKLNNNVFRDGVFLLIEKTFRRFENVSTLHRKRIKNKPKKNNNTRPLRLLSTPLASKYNIECIFNERNSRNKDYSMKLKNISTNNFLKCTLHD